MQPLISPTGSRTYLPGLDGLRAYAVMAVVAFHCGVAGFQGGWIGVDVFFGLSGFLITGLLVGEIDRRRSIDLSNFWSRRFRRLLPALVALLTLVVVLAAVVDLAVRTSGVWGAITYTTNWIHILIPGNGYWTMYAEPDPLNHLWSLAIEEQFYVIWPLVVLAVGSRHGRRAVGRAAVVLAGASVAVQLVGVTAGWSIDRLYQGTDTRAFPFLLGSALACAGVPTAWRQRSRAALPVVGAAVAVLVAATVWLDGSSRSIFLGPLQIVSVAGVVLVAEAARSRSVLLCHPTVRAIGRWSYGIYLFHWPLVIVFDDASTATRFIAVTALSVALAAVSHRLVETPVRSGRLRGWSLAPAAFATVTVTVVALAVATPIVPAAFADRGDSEVFDVAATAPAVPTTVEVSGAVPGVAPGDSTTPSPTTTQPPAPPVVAVIGDSVPAMAATQLTAEGRARGWDVRMVAEPGCVPSPHAADQFDPSVCGAILEGLADRVAGADAVVLWWGATGAELMWDGTHVKACDQPDGTAALSDRAAWMDGIVGSLPTTFVLPVPRADLGAEDAAGTRCEDEVYASAAAANGWTTVDLSDMVCPQPPDDCNRLARPDGMHYSRAAAAVVATAVMDGAARALAEAASPVPGDGPSGAVPSTATTSAATSTTAPQPQPILTGVSSVFVLGDSTAQVLADGLTSTGRFTVTNGGVWGCPIVPTTRVRESEDQDIATDYCPTAEQQLGAIGMVDPDVVVVMSASPEQWDHQYAGDDTWHSPGDPTWIAAHDAEIELLATTFPDTVFVLVDMPQARRASDDALEGPERVAVWNEQILRWDSEYDNVVVLPYAQYITDPDDPADRELRPDGVHLTDDAINRLAEEHLADELVAVALSARR